MTPELRVGFTGFDITPRFHPEFGAWGTTPSVTDLDMPLLARCVAFEEGDRRLIWYGSDLCGEPPPFTDGLRDEVAAALGFEREQVIWSTSQSHATGAIPGSVMCGSVTTERMKADPDFIEAERKRLINTYIEAGREALEHLQPARMRAGRGFCDSISYNSRFPMPTGGSKFSRDWSEGIQGGKFYDPTIGLVRFEDLQGNPLGLIFNFCCHPAVIITDKYCSPDWVGSAREQIESAIAPAPAMFIQGFCGDVHPRHMFGTPSQARRLGQRLGKAAVDALPTLIPARETPLQYAWQTVQITCQPPPARACCEEQISMRRAFIDEVLHHDPQATWCLGYNVPDPGRFTPEARAAIIQCTIDYYEQMIRALDAGTPPARSLPLTMGALRIGDVGAALSPGENFTLTGRQVRERSPFVHTLICGDTNGLFGYIGNDDEIDRGGFETDAYWKLLHPSGLRLAPDKGAAPLVVQTLTSLLAGVSD